MLKNLIKEGGIYTLATLLTKGISLLLVPFYTAYFNPSDYGILAILTVFGTLFDSVISLQLNQGLGRYVADDSTKEIEKKTIASTAIWTLVIIYSTVFVFLAAFPDGFIEIMSSDTRVPLDTFLLSAAAICINGIFYILGIYKRFLRKTKAYSLFSFSHAIFNILGTFFFVLVLGYGINGIFLASLIVTPCIIFFQYLYLRKDILLTIDAAQLKKLLAFSVPLVPAAASYGLLQFTDRFFIKEYLTFSDLGIFDIGSKFAGLVSIIILGFSMAMAPLVYQKHGDEATKTELGRIFKLFIATGTLGVLIISLFSLETLMIFTNSKYYGAAAVMPIMYTNILVTGLAMFSPGLHIKKRTFLIAAIVITTATLNIAFNYYLIATFKLVGAAVATLTSVSINNLALFYFSQKYYKIPVNYPKIILVTGVFLTAMIAGNYLFPMLELDFIKLVILKSGLIFSYALFLFRAKLFDFSSKSL
jgi:O-antigen/teichoic acid export membrane protein